MARIGLVAGYGKLPEIFSDAARKKGDTVIAFGLKGVTEEALAAHVDKLHWLEWGSFKKGLLLLVTERIEKIIMLGKLKKEIFFKGDEKLDEKARKILEHTRDRKDYSIFNEVTKTLDSIGVKVMDSTEYLKNLMVSKGILTKRAPTQDETDDISYGSKIAKELARFDIGQTIAVKDKTVIALEAVEGTDEVIKRAGVLASAGFVLIKVSRPEQDMRFDVPVIGLDTVRGLAESNGKVLALEADKILLLDRKEAIKLADEKDISIVAI